MILATAETANFTFQTLAEDKAKADKQLLAAWKRHAKQYGGTLNGVDPHLMRDMVLDGEVNYAEITLGTTLRDNETL